MSHALQLTQSALQSAKSIPDLFELEAFKQNAIANYEKTTGATNGAMVYERERILFGKLLADPKVGKKLNECSRFSIYSSIIELHVSGLTLNEGQAYIIPYGSVAQFQVGWRGRLEQMARMPQIREVYAPEVVMTNELDNFIYTLGESPRIVQHIPAKNRNLTPENRIEWVYVILDKGHRKKCVMMSRQQVLSIRDRYSIPYKQYIKNGGKWPDGNPMEPPFWVSDEIAAFKKTVVKRAYDSEPKTARQKALDEKIKHYVDHETGIQEEGETIDYGLTIDQSGANGDSVKSLPENTAQPSGESAHKIAEPTSQSGGESAEQKAKRVRRTKEQIAADKAAQDQVNRPGETKVVTGPSGTKADAETSEVIPDGGSDNPVDDLPSLDDLMNN